MEKEDEGGEDKSMKVVSKREKVIKLIAQCPLEGLMLKDIMYLTGYPKQSIASILRFFYSFYLVEKIYSYGYREGGIILYKDTFYYPTNNVYKIDAIRTYLKEKCELFLNGDDGRTIPIRGRNSVRLFHISNLRDLTTVAVTLSKYEVLDFIGKIIPYLDRELGDRILSLRLRKLLGRVEDLRTLLHATIHTICTREQEVREVMVRL